MKIKKIKEFKKFKISDYFDLSKISKKDLLSKYVDLSAFVNKRGYGNDLLINYDKNILIENRNYTVVFNTVVSEFKKDFNFSDWQFVEEIIANEVHVITLFVDYNINKDVVLAKMKALGWSGSLTADQIIDGIPVMAIYFDPIYQMSVSDEARSFKFLYHWTPTYNIDSILKYGILPKSESVLFSYPPHVHLMKGDITEHAKIYLGWQLSKSNTNQKNDGDYTLLSIKTELIPKTVAFYYDPRYKFGYYTKRKIKSESLCIIGSIKYKIDEEFSTLYQIKYI